MKKLGLVCLLSFLCVQITSAQIADERKVEKGTLIPVPDYYGAREAGKSLHKSFLKQSMLNTVLFSEDFEGSISQWTATGDWDIGNPDSGPGSGHNSTDAAGTNLDGLHSSLASDTLISPSVNLTAGADQDVVLRFYEWFELESSVDYGRVIISTDGGQTWTDINQRSGVSGWVLNEISLNSYKNEQVRIGFLFTSDGSVENDGWFVDDVEIFAKDQEPVNVNITSISTQNFPFVFLNVEVDTFGVPFPDLEAGNFTVCENGVEQTDFFEITPPEQSGGVRLADIVFIMDNSGSMLEEQQAVSDNVFAFVDSLVALGVDYNLGLTRYGASENLGDPIFENQANLTDEADDFKNNIWTTNVINGGSEPGYRALLESASAFTFRQSAQKIFIIITDETPDQDLTTISDVNSALTQNSVTVFALTENALFGDFEPLVDDPSEQIFNIYDPFESILDFIAQTVSGSYVVRYRSSNPVKDGTLREVCVEVNYQGSQSEDTTSYVPGEAPSIQRTSETIALSGQSWAQGTELEIAATVEDNVAPFVSSVTLFYRLTNTSTYQSLQMTEVGGVYSATIPSGFADEPGVDYYITASDGEVSSSTPSNNPGSNPYQIAILPNESPVVTHTVISNGEPGNSISVEATVTDQTNQVEEVSLYYRRFGLLIYNEVEMNLSTGDLYVGEIPGSDITEDGIEYYIKAVDDLGTSSSSGTADNPHFISTGSDNRLALAPVVKSILDVPNDQGGKVHIRWEEANSDNNKPDYYSIWRALPGSTFANSGVYSSFKSVSKNFNSSASLMTAVNGDTLAWEWLSNQPALNLSKYSYTAATLFDSSAATNGLHYFMVVSHYEESGTFKASAPDSGYSVDNLSPAPVANISAQFNGNKVILNWAAGQEEDLRHYKVYRSMQNTSNLNSYRLLGTNENAGFTDESIIADTTLYYLVLAEDIHDNLSDQSDIVEVNTRNVGVSVEEESNEIKDFELFQNYPNPFNPVTRIEYQLPRDSRVSFRVFDLMGREVYSLLNKHKPTGVHTLSFDASDLSSGIYIYQLRAGGVMLTRKMTLIK